MSPVERDEDGNLSFFFAKAPGQVADQGAPSGAVVVRGARSGNSKFDPKTGRFAGGSGNAEKPVTAKAAQNPTQINRTGIPQGVTPEEWERRLDTVKDAARSLGESFSNDDITTFLEGRVNDLAAVDVQSFATDVRAQQVDDVVDVFAQRLGNSGDIAVKTSNAYITRIFGQMQDTTVVNILNRLIARGFEPEAVQKNVAGRLPKDRQETIKGLFSPDDNIDDKEKTE
jgi:hypothetical protein